MCVNGKTLKRWNPGSRRRPQHCAQPRPALADAAHPDRYREAPPRRALRCRPEGVGVRRCRPEVDREQLGEEAAAAGASPVAHRLRPLQGPAVEEAEAFRGAQGSGQDQGRGIRPVCCFRGGAFGSAWLFSGGRWYSGTVCMHEHQHSGCWVSLCVAFGRPVCHIITVTGVIWKMRN